MSPGDTFFDLDMFLTEACNFIKKETLAQVFSCEFCEISKNTFFDRIPLVAASVDLSVIPEIKVSCYMLYMLYIRDDIPSNLRTLRR